MTSVAVSLGNYPGSTSNWDRKNDLYGIKGHDLISLESYELGGSDEAKSQAFEESNLWLSEPDIKKLVANERWSSIKNVESNLLDFEHGIALANWFESALNVYSEVGFSNASILSNVFVLLRELHNRQIIDIQISRSNNSEILIFRESNGVYKNLIIDSDGDISFLKIAKKIEDAGSQVFFQSDGFDFEKIINLLVKTHGL